MRAGLGHAHASRSNPYILSYSDLMAALLLIFILLLTSTLLLLQQELDQSRDKAKRITIIKYEIIEALRSAFREQGVDIQVDQSTGAIKLASDVLFDTGSSSLRPKGIETIDHLFPIYLSVLLAPQFKDDVKQIIIEGHTDPQPPRVNGRYDFQGAYLYNLALSLDRARSVADHLLLANYQALSDEPRFRTLAGSKNRLKDLLTATGMSFSRPIGIGDSASVPAPYALLQSGALDSVRTIVDFDKSRRVEFKFRLNDEEYLHQIQQLLDWSPESAGP